MTEPIHHAHHLRTAAGISPKHIKGELAHVDTFNAKFAVMVTNIVGSMWCAYVFCLLALCSLPAVLSAFAVFHGWFPPWLVKASIVSLIAWIAQTFIQLVLLSVIMVGQEVQAQASDARAVKTFQDTEAILDKMDIRTQGGLKDAVDIILAELRVQKAVPPARKKKA